MTGRSESVAIAVLVLAITGAWAATIRAGHAWVGDDVQYVLHARNVLAGRPYADIGYVYNPGGRIPVSYPPVYPAAIAPLVAFGAGWTALKLLGVACFALSLSCLAWIARGRLSPNARIGLVALVGVNPVLWNLKDYVLSEPLFTLLCLATLGVAEHTTRHGERRQSPWLGALIGLGAYLCYGTRAVGALVLVAVVAADVLRTRALARSLLFAIGVFVPLAVTQNWAVHSEAAHFTYKLTELSAALVATNVLLVYPQILSSFFDPGIGLVVMLGLGAVSLLAAGAGLVASVRERGPGATELFAVGYLGFFLTISHHDVEPIQRYLAPVFPLYALYVVKGLDALAAGRRPAWAPRAAVATFGLLLLASAFRYTNVESAPFERGADGASAQELYGFVRDHTAPDSVLVFFEPRALIYYTGRPSTQFSHDADSIAEHGRFARRVGASYWIDTGELPRHFQRRLRPVFDNGEFQVYPIDELFPRGARAGRS